MDSVPPANTQSRFPTAIPSQPKAIALIPEAQAMFTV